MPPQEQGITWHVDTHEHKERSVDWYWTLGFLALGGAALSIFLGNILFGVILLLGGGCIGALAARGPREHAVRIDQKGVVLDGTLYPYKNIESFWIDETRPAEPKLLVSTTGVLHPQLVIPLLASARATAARQYLRRFAKEEEQHMHIGEHLAELFGL
jgi:hypothetical protein